MVLYFSAKILPVKLFNGAEKKAKIISNYMVKSNSHDINVFFAICKRKRRIVMIPDILYNG